MHWNVTTTDENGNEKTHITDSKGRVIEVYEYLDDSKYLTMYNHSALGQLAKVTDNLGNVFSYTYDTLGRRTSETDPDSGTSYYQFDKNGNLVRSEDSEDNIVTYEYDDLNRITKKNSTGDSITYTYDTNKIGTLYRVIDDLSTTTYSYDNRLRMTSEIKSMDSITFTTSYTYNAMDQVLSKTQPNNVITIYTYDNGFIDGLTGVISSINYTAAGLIDTVYYDNSLSSKYSYDSENNRLTTIKTGSLQDKTFGFDDIGSVVSITDSVASDTTTMQYDDLDRLVNSNKTGEFEIYYTYDSIGNILQISESSGETNFTYSGGPAHGPSEVVTE